MLTLALPLASSAEGAGVVFAVMSAGEPADCSGPSGGRSTHAASGVPLALPAEALSVWPGDDSIFGSGLGAGGAASFGSLASRGGAGGGRGGVAAGGIPGVVLEPGVLRAAAPGLGFVVDAGADCGP